MKQNSVIHIPDIYYWNLTIAAPKESKSTKEKQHSNSGIPHILFSISYSIFNFEGIHHCMQPILHLFPSSLVCSSSQCEKFTCSIPTQLENSRLAVTSYAIRTVFQLLQGREKNISQILTTNRISYWQRRSQVEGHTICNYNSTKCMSGVVWSLSCELKSVVSSPINIILHDKTLLVNLITYNNNNNNNKAF